VRRKAHNPHTTCGLLRIGSNGADGAVADCSPSIARKTDTAKAVLRAVSLAALVAGTPAFAQDPSVRVQSVGSNKSFPGQPGGIFGTPPPKGNTALPLNLQADQLIYDNKGERFVARGNVEVFYNSNVLTADEVIYEQRANLLTARGNVKLRDQNGNITSAETLQVTDDFRDAFAQTLSVVSKDETRIAARSVARRDGNVTEYEQGKFTPCRNDPGKPPLWCISAARIVHDQQAAKITYQDAKFEFFGMPVLALPYFEHADPSVKRKSGFLAPSVGVSSTLGFRFEVPYYFALAPSYDFTFAPEYLSKQGMLWKGEFRQKLNNGAYTVKFGALNQDVTTLPAGDAMPSLDGWRGTVETRGQFSLGSWWQFGWDATVESDKSFRRFYGFDGAFQTDRVNTAYLRGQSERNYFNAQFYHFGGLLLDDTATANSRVLPVVDWNYLAAAPVLGGELGANIHARSMTRPNSATTTVAKTDTTHVVAEATWRRKVIDGIGQTWTPFFAGRADAFSFSDARDPLTGAPTQSESHVFGVGTAALTYAYPFVAHTASASHVLEPTLQVVSRHMNKPDQRFLPNEDAKSINFTEGLLFDVSKTSGYDRIDTGTRVNAGLQYSFQGNNGFNARAAFGQSFFLSGTNVFADPGKDVTSAAVAGTFTSSFNPASGLDTNRSDYVAGLYLSPLRNLSFVSQARFDEDDWSLRRNDTLASVNFGPVAFQTLYSYTAADPRSSFLRSQQELIGSASLKLTDNWSLFGSVRYDLDDKRIIQDAVGLKYADECFVLTGSFTETFTSNSALGIKPDRTFMVRFELKHLGEFNYKTDVTSFLNRWDNQ
jgi:LPS-assembly protein